MRGGYLPKIPGRPSSIVEALGMPPELTVSLRRGALSYETVVRDGQTVEFGQPLAEATPSGQRLCLPAPAAGRIVFAGDGFLRIEQPRPELAPQTVYRPERVSRAQTVQALCEGGVWPFFWSSRTGGVPNGEEIPQAVVVNAVIAEPFRARGKVVLSRSWNRIVQAIKFLPRLIADYGTIHVVLTAVRDPVARMMYAELAGYAWIRLRPVPLMYPVEHPRVLLRLLSRDRLGSGGAPLFAKGAAVWVIDVQGLEAAGACLGEGLPLHERLVVAGGPGHPHPRHLLARIGTPVGAFARQAGGRPVRLLRGGVFTGEQADPALDAVQWDDDGFFFLPEAGDREFLSFLRPGFDRASYSRTFASRLCAAADRRISTSLRGERRPCISCGLCEDICPVRIMPQVLHRYIHRELYEEANAAGLKACVECGLCSYVCPSKIELVEQLTATKALLRAESEAVK